MAGARKAVREAIKAVLADATNGLNAKVAALAPSYDVAPFEINFAAPSETFMEANLMPEDVDISALFGSDSGVFAFLYTSASTTEIDGRQHPATFSGRVIAHLDFYLRQKRKDFPLQGGQLPQESGLNLEAVGDLIEDAVNAAMMARDSAALWGNCNWNGEYSCPRESAILLGDGWEQRIPFIFPCEVHI